MTQLSPTPKSTRIARHAFAISLMLLAAGVSAEPVGELNPELAAGRDGPEPKVAVQPPTPEEAAAALQMRLAQKRQSALLAAAKLEAVDRLLARIESEPLTFGWTVGSWLDRADEALDADPRQAVRETLMQSQPIATQRPSNGMSAQVMLRVSGQRVANTLLQLSTLAGDDRPVAQDQLGEVLRGWQGRQFTAEGVSISPDVLQQAAALPRFKNFFLPARHRAGGQDSNWQTWQRVDDGSRRQAIERARQDAAAKMRAAISDVVLLAAETDDAPDTPVQAVSFTAADAMKLAGPVADEWLADRPITGVRFLADRVVEIEVRMEASDLAAMLREVVADSSRPAVATMTDDQWLEVSRRLSDALPKQLLGRAVAKEPAADAVTLAAADPLAEIRQTLPDEPPAWASQVLQATVAVSFEAGDATTTELARIKLLAAREAEMQAIGQLAAELDGLAIDRRTVLELCNAYPRVAMMRARTVAAAKRQRIEFGDDQVTVVVDVDAPALWRAISGRQVGR